MGVKKLIGKITEFLNISNFKFNSKKKSLKNLLCKLKKKRVQILKELKKDLEIQDKKKLQEELEIISFHITKAKKKLASLSS